jgi:hypothetical protein
MRGAFVIQLGPETEPADGRFEGGAQDVDLCIELRFRSSEELLKFPGQRFELANSIGRESPSRSKTRAGAS